MARFNVAEYERERLEKKRKSPMFKWKCAICELMDRIGTTDAEINALIDRIGEDKNLTEGQYRELMNDIAWGIY